jgi:arylsulfatase A-like enzyme
MNVVLVLMDSLNRHYLPVYGPSYVSTPNLDAFAREAHRFDNHFVGSLPCIPARREIFSGIQEFLWRPWGPMEPFDHRLPRLLEANGYSTAIVTDHYHYWQEQGNGYLQSFQSTELVRGHEIDFWKLPVRPEESVPRWVDNIEAWRPGKGARQYYANVRDFEGEGLRGRVAMVGGERREESVLPPGRVLRRARALPRPRALRLDVRR